MPVAKISLSFQLSGVGEGTTLSFEMVMIVPSFKIAMIRTMNGEKSNFHIKAMSMNPNCKKGTKERSLTKR